MYLFLYIQELVDTDFRKESELRNHPVNHNCTIILRINKYYK
jgi:hypothetical protein